VVAPSIRELPRTLPIKANKASRRSQYVSAPKWKRTSPLHTAPPHARGSLFAPSARPYGYFTSPAREYSRVSPYEMRSAKLVAFLDREWRSPAECFRRRAQWLYVLFISGPVPRSPAGGWSPLVSSPPASGFTPWHLCILAYVDSTVKPPLGC